MADAGTFHDRQLVEMLDAALGTGWCVELVDGEPRFFDGAGQALTFNHAANQLVDLQQQRGEMGTGLNVGKGRPRQRRQQAA